MSYLSNLNILNSKYRANPNYEIVSMEHLNDEEQLILNNIQQDRDFYGILRPKNNTLTIKLIDCDTALLFYSLQSPNKIPHYVIKKKHDLNNSIMRLVMDDILEIEMPEGFFSGAQVVNNIINDEKPRQKKSNHILSQLSFDALDYAEKLQLTDVLELSLRLYYYNRIPISTKWNEKFGSTKKIMSFLGIEEINSNVLDANWEQIPARYEKYPWFVWKKKNKLSEKQHSWYKLYVSPNPVDLPNAFQKTVEVLNKNNPSAFKIGRDVSGLLRPDKLVVYFANFSDLNKVANDLSSQLQNLLPQGVPFTAPLDHNGLLSWGIDPPHNIIPTTWQGPSWRRWLTDHLASYLIQAANSGNLKPYQFAIQRISIEGVDPNSWTPSVNIWDEK